MVNALTRSTTTHLQFACNILVLKLDLIFNMAFSPAQVYEFTQLVLVDVYTYLHLYKPSFPVIYIYTSPHSQSNRQTDRHNGQMDTADMF